MILSVPIDASSAPKDTSLVVAYIFFVSSWPAVMRIFGNDREAVFLSIDASKWQASPCQGGNMNPSSAN
jgi:hypothetical protein